MNIVQVRWRLSYTFCNVCPLLELIVRKKDRQHLCSMQFDAHMYNHP
jgi:hypothetical protein